jgi:hypothetical protein
MGIPIEMRLHVECVEHSSSVTLAKRTIHLAEISRSRSILMHDHHPG